MQADFRLFLLSLPFLFLSFEDAPGSSATTPAGFAEDNEATYVVDFLNSNEGVQLTRAFTKISDPKVRRKIIDLVKSLAAEGE